MTPQFDIDVRPAPGLGWSWRILRFEYGRMTPVAMGRAPFRWMARLDSRHFLKRHRTGRLVPRPAVRDIDLL